MQSIHLQNDLRILNCQIEEGISKPFICQFEISLTRLSFLIDEDVEIFFENKKLIGFVNEIEETGMKDEKKCYKITILHSIYRLNFKPKCQIFENKTTMDIVSFFYSSCVFLIKNNKKHEYIMQYFETDWNFLYRFLYDEGIFFITDGSHIILHDQNTTLPSPKFYQLGNVQNPDFSQNVIISHFLHKKAGPNDWVGFNYNEANHCSIFQNKTINEYPIRPVLLDEIHEYNVRKNEEYLWQKELFHGVSTITDFSPGSVYQTNDNIWEKYVIYGIIHEFSEKKYQNSYSSFLYKNTFRPICETLKPRIYGYHSAIVVGSDNGFFCDEIGRIKIQFPFLNQMSCFVRVAQSMAGDQFGNVFVPRVGMEVIVVFLDGDPSRPLVIGCCYNKLNQPARSPDNFPFETSFSTESKNHIVVKDLKDQESIQLIIEKGVLSVESNNKISFNTKNVISFHSDEKIEFNSKNISLNSDALSIANQDFSINSNQFLLNGENVKINATQNCEIISAFEISIQASGNLMCHAVQNATFIGDLATLVKPSI